MESKKYMLIINPISGHGNAEQIEGQVEKHIRRSGHELEIRHSEYAGHCRELAAEAVSRGFYAVLVAGGDGTVNEVGCALRGTDTVMGIIPRGSGNGLARHLDGSIDIDKALKVIDADHVRNCDYGTANGTPFFCTFGIGFDATVAHDFAKMNSRGLISYLRSCLRTYIKYQPKEYKIETNGKCFSIKAFVIAACNASQYGNNAYVAPEASICDGKLDLVIIHSGNPLTRALVGVDLMTGYLRRNLLVECLSIESAIIRQMPGPGHVDGEPVNMPEEIRINIHPGELKMFTDPNRHGFHPLITPIRSLRMDVHSRLRTGLHKLLNKE